MLFSANVCFSISNFACSLAASKNLLIFDCNVSPLGPAGVLLLSSLSLLSLKSLSLKFVLNNLKMTHVK
jgi:hypothetical protein